MMTNDRTIEVVVARRMWVNALRSGEYRQGKRRLTDKGEAFCCLGVACEVLGLARDSDDSGYVLGGELYVMLFPPPLCAGLGLSNNDVTTLSNLNDETDAGFEAIATFIDGLPISPSF